MAAAFVPAAPGAPLFQLECRDVTKRFGPLAAVDGVSLAVAAGEFVAVLGPSGCGKTTLLRLVAGFEIADSGTVTLAGRTVSGPGLHVPPEERRVGMVFQSYALWPHMTVKRNVGYALETARVPAADYERRVAAALAAVGLADFAARRPAELSGGQRQRVALARCLAMESRLVLFDEPLANLDMHLRAAMLDEFRAFRGKTGAALLYITHDQAEAMALADRVAVMERGRLAQVAAPERLYREPATRFVAGFVGRGAIVPCMVAAAAGGRARVSLLGGAADIRAPAACAPGAAEAVLRPEDLALGGAGPAARVRRATYRGGHYEVEAEPLAGGPPLTVDIAAAPPKPGEVVPVAVRDGWVIPAA
jgi:iron(III) transport system ATP-binding protein